MQFRIRQILWTMGILISLGLPIFLHAEDAPSGFLGGMEIELSGEGPLGNLLDYFTIRVDDYTRENILKDLKDPILDSYLTPETFGRLPLDLQNQLTHGKKIGVEVQVKSDVIVSPNGKPAVAGLPVIQTSSVLKTSSVPSDMERSSGGILIPQAKGIVAQNQQSLVLTDAQKAEARWQEVSKNWAALPPEVKRKSIDLDLLPKLVRATLFKSERLLASDFKIKKGTSPQLRDFFQRLEWVKDQSAMEFRHKTPLNDPEQVIRDIQQLTDMAGIRKYVENPNIREPDVLGFSVHYHLSDSGRDFTALAPKLRDLRLLELAEQGRIEGVFGKDSGYLDDVRDRGLYRLVNSHRIEGRTHIAGPAVEIRTKHRWMSMPPDQAEKEIDLLLHQKILHFEKVAAQANGIIDSPQTKAAVLALLTVKPESQALSSSKFEDQILRLATVEGSGYDRPIFRRYFTNRTASERFCLDLKACSTINCLEIKFRAFSRLIKEKDGSEAKQFSQAMRNAIEDDLGQWSKRISNYSIEGLHNLFYKAQPTFQESLDPIIEKIGDLIVRDTQPQNARWVESVLNERELRKITQKNSSWFNSLFLENSRKVSIPSGLGKIDPVLIEAQVEVLGQPLSSAAQLSELGKPLGGAEVIHAYFKKFPEGKLRSPLLAAYVSGAGKQLSNSGPAIPELFALLGRQLADKDPVISQNSILLFDRLLERDIQGTLATQVGSDRYFRFLDIRRKLLPPIKAETLKSLLSYGSIDDLKFEFVAEEFASGRIEPSALKQIEAELSPSRLQFYRSLTPQGGTLKVDSKRGRLRQMFRWLGSESTDEFYRGLNLGRSLEFQLFSESIPHMGSEKQISELRALMKALNSGQIKTLFDHLEFKDPASLAQFEKRLEFFKESRTLAERRVLENDLRFAIHHALKDLNSSSKLNSVLAAVRAAKVIHLDDPQTQDLMVKRLAQSSKEPARTLLGKEVLSYFQLERLGDPKTVEDLLSSPSRLVSADRGDPVQGGRAPRFVGQCNRLFRALIH